MRPRGLHHPLLGSRYGMPISGPKYEVVYDREWEQQEPGRRRVVEEHRAIWEHFHGPIPTGHDIHHLNGDKRDNRIENLECLSTVDHKRVHKGWRRVGDGWEKACTLCGEWLPLTAFYPRRSKTPVSVRSECKPCTIKQRRKYVPERNAQ